MARTTKQNEAAAKWAEAMVGVGDSQVTVWRATDVAMTHAYGMSGVSAAERARLDKLFLMAGGERAIADYLNER